MRPYGTSILVLILLMAQLTGNGVFAGKDATNGDTPTIMLAYPGVDCEPCWAFCQAFHEEAFGRLGYGFKMVLLPSERALIESNAGRVDGEVARMSTPYFERSYPNLIRVDEVVVVVEYMAYGTKATTGIKGWQGVFNRRDRVGFVKGIKFIEWNIPSNYPGHLLCPAADIVQLCRMLLADRIDLITSIPAQISALLQQDEFKDADIQNLVVLDKQETYPYLHRKHADLVPKLETAIREMKADGTYEQIMKLRHPDRH
jgi:hypothetical protein